MSAGAGYLARLLPEVQQQLEVYERKKQYFNDPVLWAKDILGVNLWSKQREICYSVRDNHNTAVAAGHSIGKSFIASVLMAWWADTRPLDQVKILSTAPSQRQVTGILWDSVRRWHALARRRYEEYKDRLENGRDLGEYANNDHPLPGYITGQNVWKSNLGIEVGMGRRPPDNMLDSAFQGVHAPYLLAIGDEAAGLNQELIDALGNNATGSENRILLIANPTDPTSAMAKIWSQKMDNWTTMNISVLDAPAITGEEGFDVGEEGGMSGWGYVNDRKEEWGEDDPRYISRVLGQWAFDAGNNLFTDEDLSFAANTHVLPDPSGIVYFGCDIARMGADATYVYARRDGDVWSTDPVTGLPEKPTGKRGSHIRYLDHWHKAPLVGDDPENLGTAQRIHNHAIAEGARVLMIDASGLGSGVVDGLHQIRAREGGGYDIVEVFGGAAPTDRRAWVNTRAEQYFRLKKLMREKALDLDEADEGLFDELRTVIFEYNDKGVPKIESKDSMKRRGVKSPDRADALWYAAMDVTAIIDNPLNGLEEGDQVVVDPWQALDMELAGPGMPM